MSDSRFLSRLTRWARANQLALAEVLQRRDWCRSLRRAQGLTGAELGRRLGVSAARVSMLERDEQQGRVTLKMMQRTARALDCELVYLLVPRQALASTSNTDKPRMKISQLHD